MSDPSRNPTPEPKRYAFDHPRVAGTIGAALLALVVVVAGVVASHPGPFGIDRAWADLMTGMRRDALTTVAIDILHPLGRFPLSWGVVALAAVLLWRDGRPWAIAALVIGEVASWSTNSLVKLAASRPRPPGAVLESSTASFPSGHAAFAAVTAVLLVGLLVPTGRRIGPSILAAGLVLVVAWSRAFLLVHWLTDLVGGLCVGLGVGLLTLASMGAAAEGIRPRNRRTTLGR